jgi:hypothetical protein
MAHIDKMWQSGVLEAAGPVGKLENARGIFLFSTPVATAKEWTAKDPKVIAGDLGLDCHIWHAPDNIGAKYRADYGQPGFKEQFAAYVAVLSDVRLSTPALVHGNFDHPQWRYFSVLPIQKLTDYTGPGKAFIWMHDPQVWPK